MFQAEVQAIKEALENTLDIYNRMESLRKEYDSIGNKLYIDMYSRSYISSIYNDAIRRLKDIVNNKTGIKQFYLKDCSYNDDYISIFNESCEKVLNLENKNILDNLKELLKTRYSYEKKERYTILNDTIELHLDFSYYLKIILNAINILKNGTLEDTEIFEKVKEALKANNTFVYRDIKITAYKNGKTKLVFASNDFKNKFIKELINA